MVPNKKIEQSLSKDFDNNDKGFYEALLDDMVTFVAVLKPDGTVIFVNNTPLIMGGLLLEDVKGKKFYDTPWWTYSDITREAIKHDVEQCATGKSMLHEIQVRAADGSLVWLEYSMHPILDKHGSVQYLVPEGRDISEHKKKEELLRHTQKMDALGKLTGGIAHDYNNLLGIIKGYTELINKSVPNNPKLTQYIQNIFRATDRGTKLTRKLLSFTQQKASEYQVVNINTHLLELRNMLEKSLTAKVTLLYELADDLWLSELDPGDLEDVIVNISINAMHAMESGGQLSFRTKNEHLSEADAQRLQLEEGDYILLSITDTGCGMDNETKEKIFDPFFSTKGKEGTGLGLSQVYSFVKRSGGRIEVFSELEHGTRFALYFPRSHKQISESESVSSENHRDLRGTESLLVVDDEIAMVELAEAILSSQGYKVITANSGVQALAILEKESIDLMISDVIMPHMDGYQLSSKVQALYPSIEIQIVSGFEDNRHKVMSNDQLRQNILYKPYTSTDLLLRVRNLLDKNPGPPSSNADSAPQLTPEPAEAVTALDENETGTEQPLNGIRILAADDLDMNLLILEEVLQSEGAQVVFAENGQQALDRIAEFGINFFDVVLMDAQMPIMDGYEATQKIHEINPELAVIGLTAHTLAEEKEHCLECGMIDLVPKPFDMDHLIGTIQKYAKKR